MVTLEITQLFPAASLWEKVRWIDLLGVNFLNIIIVRFFREETLHRQIDILMSI